MDKKKTNNTRDSLVVTDPTTNLAVRGLSKEDLTGLRVFHYLWSFVEGDARFYFIKALPESLPLKVSKSSLLLVHSIP